MTKGILKYHIRVRETFNQLTIYGMCIEQLGMVCERENSLSPMAIVRGITQNIKIFASQLFVSTYHFRLCQAHQDAPTLIAIGDKLLKLEGKTARSIDQSQMEKPAVDCGVLRFALSKISCQQHGKQQCPKRQIVVTLYQHLR